MPTGPEVGDKLVIAGVTEKVELLLGVPFTVATTLAASGDKLVGTVATILVAFQLVTVAVAPPIVNVLPP